MNYNFVLFKAYGRNFIMSHYMFDNHKEFIAKVFDRVSIPCSCVYLMLQLFAHLLVITAASNAAADCQMSRHCCDCHVPGHTRLVECCCLQPKKACIPWRQLRI